MAQNQLRRELGELSYESGQVSELEIPRSHYFERLGLLLDYEVESDGTDGASENSILELIDRVEVVLNGNQTLKSTSFALSHFVDWYQYATRPVHDAVDHTQDDVTAGSTQTGQLQTFVDFAVAPGDKSAMLPSFKLSDAVLRIKWGTAADVGSDISVIDATVNVQSKERLRASVADTQNREQQVLNNLMAFKERERRKTLDTAGMTAIKMPRGNVYYATPFQVIDGDAPSDTLVDSFEVVEDGVETHRAVDFGHAKAQDKQEYNLEGIQDGFAYVNFGHRGNLSDVLSTANMDSFELQVDTDGTAPSGTSHVRTLSQEIIR